MTTELEKQFFDTFGIEPKDTITCIIEEDWLNDYHLKTWYPISEWMKNNAPCKGEKECSNKCNCYQVKNEYPQITDRQLLELLCILSKQIAKKHKGKWYEIYAFDDYEFLKETILNDCRLAGKEIKHQVQAIFEDRK